MTRLAEVWRRKTVHSPSRRPEARSRSLTASVTSLRPRRVATGTASSCCRTSLPFAHGLLGQPVHDSGGEDPEEPAQAAAAPVRDHEPLPALDAGDGEGGALLRGHDLVLLHG